MLARLRCDSVPHALHISSIPCCPRWLLWQLSISDFKENLAYIDVEMRRDRPAKDIDSLHGLGIVQIGNRRCS
jgi:hypothetical protein